MKKILKTIYLNVIRWPLIAAFVKYYIVLKYKRLNQSHGKKKSAITPWVCEFQFNVDRWVDYINEVYTDYFENSGLNLDTIKGKRILEVGPGENLGVALKLLSAGALQVVCVDKFSSLIEKKKQLEIYKKIYSQMSKGEQEKFQDAIRIKEDEFTLNENRLIYLNRSIEELNSIYPEPCFDIIISRAVLEHVFSIDSAMETMDSLLKKGGYMLHEVDFQDHGIFTGYGLHPLTFLSIKNTTWLKMASNIGAPNRMLSGYYQSFFEAHGYTFKTKVVRILGSNKKVSLSKLPKEEHKDKYLHRLTNKIGNKSNITNRDDLRIAAAFYCARKSQ